MTHETIGGQLTLPNGTRLPLSKAVRAGDYLHLSGQLALGPDGKLHGSDIRTQTAQCLDNIAAILDEAGASLANVVKATVWLVNREDFSGFNEEYATRFAHEPPARSAVCSGLMLPGALVEIEVLAYAPR